MTGRPGCRCTVKTSSVLAIGLLNGIPEDATALPVTLTALIVLTLYVADHPRLFARHRTRTLRLDSAHTDEDALRAHLAVLLGGRVVNLSVKNIDLVNDTTLVEVRYVVAATRAPVPSPDGTGGLAAATGALGSAREIATVTAGEAPEGGFGGGRP
ncbi:DUF4956 domain-containing protein [Streptomyces sp. NPDC014995]|uniref:DUF4956 domain-containing protein n=1 Tax=Streptomyces sp. NPDC014995 TaxID=3364936 RepID=UPI0036FC437D